MNLNEYLFKTSQSLMKRVLMYINVDNNQNLLEIKNNDNINFDAESYEWAVISTLLLSSERYLDDIKIEDSLTDKDVKKIEQLLSESEEILPGDDSRQTQNCILDNDNNTVSTFDYLINGDLADFSIDAFLGELEGFGSYYEDDINIVLQENEINDIQELKKLKSQIVQKQYDANKANGNIITNGRLNTRNFVEWLRNALAHSHYVPYNEKQLRFFIKGKESNNFNVIIDKQVVAAIINMVYYSAKLSINNNDRPKFEILKEEIDEINEFKRQIEEDLEDTLYWFKEREKILFLFKKKSVEFKNYKNLEETITKFINELPENEYYYSKKEMLNIVNSILNDDQYTNEEKQEEIIDYLGEIKNRIEEDNALNDAKFGWIYECNNINEFEQEITDYLIHNTDFIDEENITEILKIAKSNPDYNNNELFNKNKIMLILKTIIDKKTSNTHKIMSESASSKINEIYEKLKSKKVSYKLLIKSLLKCNLLDGFNMNENNEFENIDFSKFLIPRNIICELTLKERQSLSGELKKRQAELIRKTRNIQKNERILANRKVDNEYFLIKLPQDIAKDKKEESDLKNEISQLISDIDALNKGTFNMKILNQQIMRHLRNALAHGNVDIKFVDKEISTAVVIFKDIDENNELTFQGSIKLIDLLEIISSNEFQQTIFNMQENTNKKAK